MGIVGGVGIIEIATALPPSFVYCIVNIKYFMDILYLILYPCLRLRFLYVEPEAADTDLKLLDSAVSGARFLTGGVFECDIAHCRSVAVLCMLSGVTRCIA